MGTIFSQTTILGHCCVPNTNQSMSIHSSEQRSEIYNPIRNGKVILSADQVLEIYKCKLAIEKHNNGIRARGISVSVSRMYQVSPKTIRDIWNHITWRPVTGHLWRSDMEFFNETSPDSPPTARHLCCPKENVMRILVATSQFIRCR